MTSMSPTGSPRNPTFELAFLDRPEMRPVRISHGDSRVVGRTPECHVSINNPSVSREHAIEVSKSGLVTVTGGKWTTYRAMAEDVLQRGMQLGRLPARPGGRTEHLPLLGAAPGQGLWHAPGEHLYGSEVPVLQALPGARRWIARDAETGQGVLSEAMVRFAARHEMARSVEDVLARRSRLLFLDAAQAAAVADEVGAVLAEELGPGFDAPGSAAALRSLAHQYATPP